MYSIQSQQHNENPVRQFSQPALLNTKQSESKFSLHKYLHRAYTEEPIGLRFLLPAHLAG